MTERLAEPGTALGGETGGGGGGGGERGKREERGGGGGEGRVEKRWPTGEEV